MERLEGEAETWNYDLDYFGWLDETLIVINYYTYIMADFYSETELIPPSIK